MKTEMDIVATYKPTGLKTHRSSEKMEDWGFAEWLQEKWGEKLYLFQRLDAGTSGLLLFAKSESSAQIWTDKFKNKTVKKTYLLITKGKQPQQKEFLVRSHISKIKGQWVSQTHSLKDSEWNSETQFTWIRSHGDFHLWKAEPKTGKAHQIRLHAQDLGFPLLGDKIHGGASFFRLCLHAHKLEEPETQQSWGAPAPLFFDKLELLSNVKLCALLEAQHQREQMIQKGYFSAESYRLSHLENSELRIDAFGDHLWVYNYYSTEYSLQADLNNFFSLTSPRPTWIREMKNRGQDPLQSQLQNLNEAQTRWQIQENSLHFELRSDQGLSPGLFLDQRDNRLWVKKNSSGKKVLNLFSYTCGFSLNAAIGGAIEVVSVDASSNFLEWGKRNFEINHLKPEHYEFRASDVMEFLKKTLKIGRSFDLIICDPPSFGRSKKSIFNIEKDINTLTELCFQLLSPQGKLLLSTNFEKWSRSDFEIKALKNLLPSQYHLLKPPYPGLDFLEPDEVILKTLILQKK